MANAYGPYFYKHEFRLEGADKRIKENIFLLVRLALHHIRHKFGPVTITSAYRNPDYNKIVGGSPTSQHLHGEACDFVVKGEDMLKVFEYIRDELKWPGQCFYYKKSNFIHIALPRTDLHEAKRLYCKVWDK